MERLQLFENKNNIFLWKNHFHQMKNWIIMILRQFMNVILYCNSVNYSNPNWCEHIILSVGKCSSFYRLSIFCFLALALEIFYNEVLCYLFRAIKNGKPINPDDTTSSFISFYKFYHYFRSFFSVICLYSVFIISIVLRNTFVCRYPTRWGDFYLSSC